MGSYVSRRMGDDESISSSTSDEDTDSETNYSEIFQRLINRYTNGHFSTCYSDLSNDYCGTSPKIKQKPNTMKLDASEFYYSTKLGSSVIDKNMTPSNNIASMILDRATGKYSQGNFTKANRCRISNYYLPNVMEELDSYEGKVFCGTFSKDGKYFITASQDQQIRLYKTDNGKYELYKTIHARDVGWSIIDVAFSPDREHFVYSTWSTSLHLCPVNGDPDKQEPLCLVNTARRFCIFSLAFSSDGNEILGGANDGILYIYDRQRNARSLKISAHEFDINTVAFADDSSHIIYSGSDDSHIKVWDRRTLGEGYPKPVGVLAGHMDGITYICPKGDGRHLISNSKDQSIKLWDVRVFSGENAANKALRVIHQTWDYRWQDVPKKLYNVKGKLEGDTSIMTYRGHIITRTLIRCRFSPVETTGQRYIYTGCGSGRLVIYDALTGKIKRDEKKHATCVRDVSWHPYNNEILTSSWDGSVGRWFYSYKDRANEKRKNPDPVRRSERIAQKKKREDVRGEEAE